MKAPRGKKIRSLASHGHAAIASLHHRFPVKLVSLTVLEKLRLLRLNDDLPDLLTSSTDPESGPQPSTHERENRHRPRESSAKGSARLVTLSDTVHASVAAFVTLADAAPDQQGKPGATSPSLANSPARIWSEVPNGPISSQPIPSLRFFSAPQTASPSLQPPAALSPAAPASGSGPAAAPAARTLAPVASPTTLAANSTNPIVLENQKPGNPASEWDLSGPASSNIEGFTTQISTNIGGTVDFKINTDSNNYRIDIYRLGYYGGMGARKVATIQHTGVQNQPNPITDASTGLVDAGNWGVSGSWQIPTDAVSGVYLAKLVRQDGTFGESQIPFVVRDDSRKSDMVFQTSDATWQAYNPWGGANFYAGNGPGTGSLGTGRAYKVSYNRPITTRDGGLEAGPQDFVFGAEFPAIRWLEENGYDVSYLSGVDTARSGNLLLNHKIFLSVGHDEYWAGEQRANVEAARDAGVNLAFLSGNEVYWKTRWEPSIAGQATDYRTLVSYKETWANADIDPSNQWTGTYRDPRFVGPNALGGGNPENSLTGTLYQVDAYRQDTMQIPYADASMRFWRNTSVANLQPGQVASLPTGYLGYEWDEDRDNGFRPAGLIDMSSTTVNVNSYLLDYGNTVGPGTATHSLTLYRAPSGALVFGAGTVYLAWGLDPTHDNEQVPADPRVQQAMINLFADMGVQPATLQPGLVAATQSTDHAAPVSMITAPGASSSFNLGQLVTITGTAADSGGGIVGGVEVSTDSGTTWHEASGRATWTYSWIPEQPGSFTIKSRAADDSANLETPGAGTAVTVNGGVSLFSYSATPATASVSDTNSVELGMKFSASANGTISGVRFYKGTSNTGTHTGSLWTSTGTVLATATFTNEAASGWQTTLFSSPISISAGTTYVVSYHTAGNYADDSNYFASPVTNGPLTAPSSSSSGGNGVYAYGGTSLFPTNTFNASNYWVDVVYNQGASVPDQPPVAVNDTGFTTAQNTPLQIAASVVLANDSDPDGDPLSVTSVSAPNNGTVAFDSVNKTITFTPANNFAGAAGFTYTISDGRGGTASANVSLTVNPPNTSQSLFAANATPAIITDSDSHSVELGVKFSVSTNGTVSAIRFYKGPQNTGTHTGSLWTSTGTNLGTVTFTNETTSGWQTATFSNPIAVTAGTTYVASYHSGGFYSASGNYFTSAVTSGNITAPASASSGGNGVYAYGTASIFPTSSYNAANYWVDVAYNPGAVPPNQIPVANNDSGFSTNPNTILQIAASSVLANDTDPDGDPLTVTGVSAPTNGTVAFNGQNNIITFTPANNYTGAAGFTYSISDGRGGTASANVSINVIQPTQGLFAANATPATVTVNDNQPVELGMKFSSSAAGSITGVRFYKGPQNTGTHTGTLWSATGTQLATTTFTNETASGWQSANFSSPVSIAANTNYVVSYHSNGNYSADNNYFTNSVSNGPLTAPSSTSGGGNGVYAYGAASAFPTSSFNSSNYWVDVMYHGQLAA